MWFVPDSSAVIVDQWALVRLGIGAVLRSLDVRVVGDEASARDGLQLVRESKPDVVVLGSHLDVAVDQAVKQAAAVDPPPRILVLLDTATRDELAALFSAGADGALLRSATGDELFDALERLMKGERVLAPAFVPVLAGVMNAPAGRGDGERADAALTPKEREVLALLAQGRSNRQIAETLFISGATVKTHLTHLYEKLGVQRPPAGDHHCAGPGPPAIRRSHSSSHGLCTSGRDFGRGCRNHDQECTILEWVYPRRRRRPGRASSTSRRRGRLGRH